MCKAELLGSHTHSTAAGIDVHVWIRDSRYIARGSIQKRRFGPTLGSDPKQAAVALRRLLADIDDGCFTRPSERPVRSTPRLPTTAATFDTIADRYIDELTRSKGRETGGTLASRLEHAQHFFARQESRKRWPNAVDIDRAAALEFRAYLSSLAITRNGHANGTTKPMSQTHVRNVLGAVQMALRWAQKSQIRLLPADFEPPFDPSVVPPKRQRDILTPPTFPMEQRIRLVDEMNAYELATLALPMLLPLREEDFAVMMVSTVNRDTRRIRVGDAFEGELPTKARAAFTIAYPPALDWLIVLLVDNRADGPLLLREAVIRLKRARPVTQASLLQDMAQLPQHEVATVGDRKNALRRLLSRAGGVDGDDLRRTFNRVKRACGFAGRFHELRGSNMTDMRRAGVDLLLRKYFGGRRLSGEIQAVYESGQVDEEIGKYFSFAQPVIAAINGRAQALGLLS
jgi:hypothetical protein